MDNITPREIKAIERLQKQFEKRTGEAIINNNEKERIVSHTIGFKLAILKRSKNIEEFVNLLSEDKEG